MPKLCRVCGLHGSKQCSKCHAINYCGKEHQVIDWKNGHKDECDSIANTPNPPEDVNISFGNTIFPEWEVVTEPEPKTFPKHSDSMKNMSSDFENINITTKSTIDTNGSNTDVVNENDDDENDENADSKVDDTQVDVDKAFLDFQRRITLEPQQVIR